MDRPRDASPNGKPGRAALRAVLARAVDYAGLFPPAALSMAAACREYAAAHAGPDDWMLGRFVVPAARLPEFAAASSATSAAAWSLSAVVGDGSEDDRTAVATFDARAVRRQAAVEAIESKPSALEGIDWLAETFGGRFDVYVEVPAGDDATRWLERVRARGLKAKVRTGGVTAGAFPSPAALLAFIDAAVHLQVPFKATAGLHHAVRGTYRLTGEADASQAPMYGYLNLVLATAARRAGLPLSDAEGLLRNTDAASLAFGEGAVRWGAVELPLDLLGAVREQQFVSFGSCSFLEPADEWHALTAS
jgi:hypothetical protein